MSDETPQPQQPENVNGASVESVERIERSAGTVITDVALGLSPLLPVAAQMGKDWWDDHNAQKQDQPQVILPPGVEDAS